MDTLSAFLADLSPSQVERERLGNYRLARKETFDKAAHRKMLISHELQTVRFKAQLAANERTIDASRRRASEQADAELVAAYKQRRAEKRAI